MKGLTIEQLRKLRLENDPILLERTRILREETIKKCNICGGEGYIETPFGLDKCSCQIDADFIIDLTAAGMDNDAHDLYQAYNSGHSMVDVKYRKVYLNSDPSEIQVVKIRKWLYRDLLAPYLNNLDIIIGNGDSLVMFGNNGRGKTWALYYVGVVAMLNGYSAFYITLREAINIITKAMYEQSTDPNVKIIYHILKNSHILLLDEGSKLSALTPNTMVQFESLIKYRVSSGFPILIATNHSPKDFSGYFGSQVLSAFIKNVYAVYLSLGLDLRIKDSLEAEKSLPFRSPLDKVTV